MKTKLYTYCIVLAIFIPLLIVLNILVGSVYIPFSDVMAILSGDTSNELQAGSYIIYGLRLPQVITAMLCGASLATSGLLLQTTFKNPLAGPSLFGIDAGAALGVALVLLMMGGNITLGGLTASGYAAVLIAAFNYCIDCFIVFEYCSQCHCTIDYWYNDRLFNIFGHHTP